MTYNYGDYLNTTYDSKGNAITSSPTTSGNLTGTAYDYSAASGGKPTTADPTASAASAITGTTSNLGSLYGLADSANTFSANQAVNQQNILTPGYSGNMDKWASDISDLLSGKVSSGTVNTISQNAAERGVSTGLTGSLANESALLRSLGLTSEQQQATGASQLASMVNTSPKASAFDLTPYLTTGADVTGAQNQANTIASAANPAAASAAAVDAAKTGVAAGQSAAGSTPSTSGTQSSIASLLSSILGTGGAATPTGGGSAAANPVSSNQSFEDWYKSVYGNNAYGNFGDAVATDETGAAATDTGSSYDNTNAFDASAYA
jgi:hypothetical protein